MAILHVKTPNGTTKTVDLETMNITSSLQQNGWCKLPNGLIIQWGRNQCINDIVFPITMVQKFCEQAIHYGSDSTVNIISYGIRTDSPDISYFISNFQGDDGHVLIEWMCIGTYY